MQDLLVFVYGWVKATDTGRSGSERQRDSFEICPSGVNLKIILSFTLYGVTNPVTEVTKLVTHEESLTLRAGWQAEDGGNAEDWTYGSYETDVTGNPVGNSLAIASQEKAFVEEAGFTERLYRVRSHRRRRG